MTKKELYKKALEQWGTESQLSMMAKECAELIKAIQKFNYRGGCLRDVIEGLADVEIMCEQMRIVFGSGTVSFVKRGKLERLQGLLTGESICQ